MEGKKHSERMQNWWRVSPLRRRGVERLREKIKKLEEEVEELKDQIGRDPLTGLLNRRGLDDLLQRYIEIWKRNDKLSLYVFLIDIDNFKQLNDVCGHKKGDELLKTVASSWQNSLRGMDIIAIVKEEYGKRENTVGTKEFKNDDGVDIGRIGGDEFMVLAFTTNPEVLKERLQGVFNKVVEEVPDVSLDILQKLGVSIGWARIGEAVEKEVEDLPASELFSKALNLADQRMYEEKRRKKAER